MKIERKELKTIDGKEIVQITTEDERWYLVDGNYVPSTTWICSFYPKGVGFMRWLAEHGWDEAEALKQAAAEKGSKVHQAITDLVNGKEVRHDSKFVNHDKGVEEELTAIEYGCVVDFSEWWAEAKPTLIGADYTLYSEKHGYAGTVDLKVKIGQQVWIIDLKTSQDIYPSHELQVSAYKNADKGVNKIAILQVGYRRNRIKHYKFTEIEDQFALFLDVKNIWAKETAGQLPSQKDYPISVVLHKPAYATDTKTLMERNAKLINAPRKKKVVIKKKTNAHKTNNRRTEVGE